VPPTPKSLILDLLSTVGRGSAPVRALVSAGALFGLAENSVRVALARLLADGLAERDARGRYRLGPGAAPVNEQIRGWKRVEDRLERWSGGWVAVHTGAAPRRGAPERRRSARALRLLGFRLLAPGLEVRPDNLVGGVAAVRERLVALGLGPELPVCGLRGLDPTWEERARALWNRDELLRAYRSTCRRLAESAARLPDLPRDAARVESFSLGGAAIRQLVLDPLLPEPIAPAAERRALVQAMHRYDRLGRRIWAGWLGEDAKAPSDLPAGVRGPRPAADDLESPDRS
jgi:phenylacetic acid degradation operon negative regulatory protein